MPNLDWGIFWQTHPDFELPYWRLLLDGLGWTVAVSLAAWIMAMLLGIAVGTLRTAPNRAISGVASAYIELFRNIPLLVQMFLWYFVVPELIPPLKAWIVSADIATAQFVVAVVC